jgi:hypothetical protein
MLIPGHEAVVLLGLSATIRDCSNSSNIEDDSGNNVSAI